MTFLANVFGILAVVLFVLSYQIKNRKGLIAANAASRVFYVTQYILLGAFEGAALDICGILSSLLAAQKHRPRIRKYALWILIFVDALIVFVGLLLYQNVYSLLPIIGVLLHTSAFWIENEKIIRLVSLLGCPFWFIYNVVSGAYGSCIGDALSALSLVISIVRYDLLGKNKA
jgi:hypothetical protein